MSSSTVRLTLALAFAPGFGLVVTAFADGEPKPAARYSEPVKIGLLEDKRLTEVSGIVPVTGLERCYWVHNDSGDKPRILAIRESGDVIADVAVRGCAATDWEDIAKGPGPKKPGEAKAPVCIFIADTGNNDKSRRQLVVWRFREPELPKALTAPAGKIREALIDTEPAARLRFRYPGETKDCEAMVVHPETGSVYFLTKGIFGGSVFRIEGAVEGLEEKVQTADEVCSMGRTMMTAADLSADAKRLVVRTYLEVQLYLLPEGKPFEEIFAQPKIDLPRSLLEVQGESICFDTDGSVVTVSEAKPKVIHRISPAGISPGGASPSGAEGKSKASPPPKAK